MISLEEIRGAIEERSHTPAAFEATSAHAAVAMILVDGVSELEVCFIRRAERDGDPWSGQVAFPGGRADRIDRDAYAVAERETWEEIGLELTREHRIGPLPIRPIDRSGVHSMTLSPFVYYIPAELKKSVEPRQLEEVAHVFWVPMSHLFDHSAATDLEYPMAGGVQTFRGILFDDHIIWGLTLRVLNSFAQILGRSLPVEY